MYKVIYQLPFNQVREIVLSEDELNKWLGWTFLRERIIRYEKIS